MRTALRVLHYLTLGLSISAMTAQVAVADITVRVRVGEHADFDRMVFDWPGPMDYRVQQSQGRAIVIFEAAAELDLTAYHGNPPRSIRNLTAGRVDGAAAVRFEFPVNARLKHAAWDNKVVVDVLRPADAALVWNPEPAAAPSATAPVRPQQSIEPPKAEPAPPKLSLKVEAAPQPEVKPAPVVETEPPEPREYGGYRDETRHFSFGPNVSTLGVGGETGYLANSYVGLRLVGNYLPADFNVKADDVRYDAELDWTSLGGVVDVYPFGGGFRLSAGARYNSNTIELDATPSRNVNIGGQTFTPSEVGTIRSDVEFARFAPYAGLGYEARFLNGRLGLGIDLGVYYQGNGDVDSDATGTLANDPGFRQALQNESDELEDELGLFNWYPVVGVSMTLRF